MRSYCGRRIGLTGEEGSSCPARSRCAPTADPARPRGASGGARYSITTPLATDSSRTTRASRTGRAATRAPNLRNHGVADPSKCGRTTSGIAQQCACASASLTGRAAAPTSPAASRRVAAMLQSATRIQSARSIAGPVLRPAADRYGRAKRVRVARDRLLQIAHGVFPSRRSVAAAWRPFE